MKQDVGPDEVLLPFDPATEGQAELCYIGKIRSPWAPGTAPGNIRRAREDGRGATIELDPRYVPGLSGLSVGDVVVLMYWFDQSRRDLIVQVPPFGGGPRGVFSLRSPKRPNPIALASVTITELDLDAARIGIDAIDCFDGTPLLDIKPWIATIDTVPSDEIAIAEG